MQTLFSNKKSVGNSTQSSQASPITVPHLQYRKIIDLLEYKWGANVLRRKNEFYLANRQDRPIARLSSRDSIIVSLVDQTSGKWHEVKTKIDDIELPKPILVEQRIYVNLLYQLVRASGEGITRWINKFYSTATGKVIAEILSKDKIRVYKTDGTFVSSSTVLLEDYAALRVPREQYFHLLDFLVQHSGGEVRRVGNEFYPLEQSEFLDSLLKSLWAVSRGAASYLDSKILAELVSSDTVRFPDRTTRKISDLPLTHRVFRSHLYFCNSCQSFVRIPYRTPTHMSRSSNHAIKYLSSSISIIPISKKTNKNQRNKFPEILYKFWGIEKAKVPKEKRKESQIIKTLPILANIRLEQPRPTPTSQLLLSAEITIDGHRITNGERQLAFQRLEEDKTSNPDTPNTEHLESTAKEQEDSTEQETLDYDPIENRQSPEIDELPELLEEN